MEISRDFVVKNTVSIPGMKNQIAAIPKADKLIFLQEAITVSMVPDIHVTIN